MYSFFSHKWINKLFSEEKRVSRTLFEARKVAGSAKYKQMKTKSMFIYSVSKELQYTAVHL